MGCFPLPLCVSLLTPPNLPSAKYSFAIFVLFFFFLFAIVFVSVLCLAVSCQFSFETLFFLGGGFLVPTHISTFPDKIFPPVLTNHRLRRSMCSIHQGV